MSIGEYEQSISLSVVFKTDCTSGQLSLLKPNWYQLVASYFNLVCYVVIEA